MGGLMLPATQVVADSLQGACQRGNTMQESSPSAPAPSCGLTVSLASQMTVCIWLSILLALPLAEDAVASLVGKVQTMDWTRWAGCRWEECLLHTSKQQKEAVTFEPLYMRAIALHDLCGGGHKQGQIGCCIMAKPMIVPSNPVHITCDNFSCVVSPWPGLGGVARWGQTVCCWSVVRHSHH